MVQSEQLASARGFDSEIAFDTRRWTCTGPIRIGPPSVDNMHIQVIIIICKVYQKEAASYFMI